MKAFFTEAKKKVNEKEDMTLNITKKKDNNIDSYFYNDPHEASEGVDSDANDLPEENTDSEALKYEMNQKKLQILEQTTKALEDKFKELYQQSSQDKVSLDELKQKKEVAKVLGELRELNKRKEKLQVYLNTHKPKSK